MRMTLEDKATIANMAPEYGATCGFFPVDAEAMKYLDKSGRDPAAHRAWSTPIRRRRACSARRRRPDPVFTDALELDLDTVEPSLAGPKRPQDRVLLSHAKAGFLAALEGEFKKPGEIEKSVPVKGFDFAHQAWRGDDRRHHLLHQHLQPLGADRGRARRPQGAGQGACSPSPGSRPRSPRARRSSRTISPRPGLQDDLDALGFNLVGFGCTTCIGNSGPLPEVISDAINAGDLVAAAVLSGNRNFEGRVNPDVKANYLASPPLVVAYALAGSMQIDLVTEPLGMGKDGSPVFLKDIWPSPHEIQDARRRLCHQVPVQDEVCRRLQGRRELAGDHRADRARPMPGTKARPMCRTRPISSACRRRRRRRPT